MKRSFFGALIAKRSSRRSKAAGYTVRAVRLVELLEERQLLAAANPVISIEVKAPVVLPQFNGQQYLAMVDATQTRLFTTNGTQPRTVQVATFPAAMTLRLNTAVLNNELYFSAKGTAGDELWKTNGTTAGSVQVLDINPGTVDSSPAGFELLNGFLYFAATNRRQTWLACWGACGSERPQHFGSTIPLPRRERPVR
jgi:ELWxxDGT repeat protein